MLTDAEIKADLIYMIQAMVRRQGRDQSSILTDALDAVNSGSRHITLRDMHSALQAQFLITIAGAAKRKRE